MRPPSSIADAARRMMQEAPLTTILLLANVIVFLILELTGGSTHPPNLYRWGAKFGPAIKDGDWFRLIAPIFMHAGMIHLFLNSFALLIFGPALERIFGGTAFIVTYMIAGIFGVAASYWFSPALGVGASGAIFGIIGAFAVYLAINRQMIDQQSRQLLVSLIAIIAINIALGLFIDGIDQAAHVGGLIAGAAMALAVSPIRVITVSDNPFAYNADYVSISTLRRSYTRIVIATIIGIIFILALLAYVSSTVIYDSETIQQHLVFEFIANQ